MIIDNFLPEEKLKFLQERVMWNCNFPFDLHNDVATDGDGDHLDNWYGTSLIYYDSKPVIEFYEDVNFKSKYNSNLITKTDAKTTVLVGSSLASEFYYKVEGKNTNNIKTLSFAVDERVPNYSQLVVVDSKFNKPFKVIGIGTNVFEFNPTGIAETSSYTSTGYL